MRTRAIAGAIFLLLAAASAVYAQDTEFADDIRVYLEPERLLSLIEEQPEGFFLVDTRTWEEYLDGHMPGAIHAEYRTIADNLPTEDKDALIIVYCLRGIRSNRAARTLRRLGYTRVLDWGGIRDWPYRVVTGPDPFE